MTLIYEDHFDKSTLDTSKWGHTMGIYTIQNSNLILGGSGRGGEVRGYKGSNPFAMKYGYIEIRAKFGGAGSNKGFVNQLWLIHRQDEFEIDITETPTGPIDTSNSFYGINKINSSYHYYNYSGYRTKQYNTGVDLSKDYHIYAVEWTKDYIRYLFDNKEYYRVSSSDVPISNLDMYIILGLCAKCRDEEAAGCWSSQECASGDAKLYIDYVRVYDQIQPKKYMCTGTPNYQCVEDPNGPYNSLAECQAACKAPVTKYRCTGTPNYQCVEDPNGPYNSLAECQAACKAPVTKYRCTGSPNYQCVEDPNGPYNSLAECQAACKTPVTKYRCTGSPNYQCVEDPNGPYNSLAECQAVCKAPVTKYRCTGTPNYQCVEDPNGPYNSLAECQAACKAPVTKYRCTGSPNYQCVEDPNGPYNSLAECQAACKPQVKKFTVRTIGSPTTSFGIIVLKSTKGEYTADDACKLACDKLKNMDL